MASPQSATTLPLTLPNIKAPICNVTSGEPAILEQGGIFERRGEERMKGAGYVTQAWRYFFGSLAQKSPGISASWTQAISNPPTQAQVEALVAQVQLLTKQLAGSQ